MIDSLLTIDFLVIYGILIGFGTKSRLPIGNPGIWLDSGAGWAFFIPNPDYVVRGQSTAIGRLWASSEDLFLPERAWDAGRISGDEGISQHLNKLVLAP